MKKYIFFVVLLYMSICLYSNNMFMNIMLGNNKIGWYIAQTDSADNMIKINEKSRMSLIVYGNTVNIYANNLSIYDKNYNLVKFFSNINSEQMSFYINGFVNKDQLITHTDLGNNIYIDTFNIKNKKILFNIENMDKKLFYRNDLYIFNPLYRDLEKINIEKINDTIIIVKSKTMNTKIVFNRNNEILKSITAEGLVMQTTESVDSIFDDFDIVNYFLIKAEGDYKNIMKQNKGKYILYSIKNRDINNYRQEQKGDTVIIYKKPLYIPDSLSSVQYSYIKPNKEIKDTAKKLMQKYTNKEKLLKEIMQWVSKRISSRIVSGLVSIDEILDNGYGDCTEHAQLFASLANECGFEVDIVSGIVYSQGYFYYHAWNRVKYNNKIYTIDPTFKQFNADITHIQLSEGFPPSKILIGNLEEQLKIKKIK